MTQMRVERYLDGPKTGGFHKRQNTKLCGPQQLGLGLLSLAVETGGRSIEIHLGGPELVSSLIGQGKERTELRFFAPQASPRPTSLAPRLRALPGAARRSHPDGDPAVRSPTAGLARCDVGV